MTPGERVGPYVVLSELGRGGMGLVLRARHQTTGAEVALKVLDAALVDAEAVVRFDLEGQALARVASEGVVPVHAAGVDGRRRWIALGLMEGGSLRDRMKTSGAWPWERAVELARGLAATLGRCHAAGIVHRDLKPENILFDAAGRAHVADFGLVRDLATQALTATGTVLGTPAYMAPEQLEGLRVDARADVWSLAVILHELVAGERPWVGKQTVQLLARITATPRPRLADRGAPPELDAVLDGALTLEPGPRYPDAATLAAELGLVLARQAPRALLAATARRRRRRLLLASVVASLLVALGLCVQAVRLGRRRAEAQEAGLLAAIAAIDSSREGLRRARVHGDPPPAEAAVALDGAARLAEAWLGGAGEGEGSVAARSAAARARLELAVVASDRTGARAAAAGLSLADRAAPGSAHLVLLGELTSEAPERAPVEAGLAQVLAALGGATGDVAVDLRLAAARAEVARGDIPAAAALLGPRFVGEVQRATRGELLLDARLAGLACAKLPALVRRTLDRARTPVEETEAAGAAALDGLLAPIERAKGAEGDLAEVALRVRTAWDLELEHRERLRAAVRPRAAKKPPLDRSPNDGAPPPRPPRPARTLVRPAHAPSLRAALAQLEAWSDAGAPSAAARAYELLAVVDPSTPAPTRTWARLQQLYEEEAGQVERADRTTVEKVAGALCDVVCDMLRVGLPVHPGGHAKELRLSLQRAVAARVVADDRDWALEALDCALDLHLRRNFPEDSREPERATLRRPLLTLAGSPLLAPAARAALALDAAELGLVVACDANLPQWAAPATTPERRAVLDQARALLLEHRPRSSTPDLIDAVLAEVALALGETAEAARLAQSVLAVTAKRDAGLPDDGRPLAPPRALKPALQVTDAVLKRLRAAGDSR